MEENYKDIFKRQFDDHEDDIDPQIIWDNIRPKKKRRLIWWRLSLLLVLLLTPIVYLYLQNDQLIVAKDQASEFVSSGEQNVKVVETKDTSANENSSMEIAFNHSQEDIPGKKEIKTKSQSEKTFTEVKKSKEDEINKTGVTRRNLRQKNVTNESRSVGQTEEMISYEESQIGVRKFPTEEDPSRDLHEANSKNQQDGSQEIIGVANTEMGIELLNPLGSFLLIAKPTIYELGMTPSAREFEKEEAQKELTTRGFSVGMNADYGILNTERESNSADLLLDRLNTVENLESLRFNALLSYHFGPRISVSSGLQYTRLNELFTWQGVYVSSEFGEYIDTVEETVDGTILTLVEGEHEVERTRNMRIYNKTNLISIPLMLHLSQAIGDFKISIGGGIEANVLQGRDGYVLSELGTPITLQDQEQSDFGFNYVGRLGVEYRIAENISLSANVGYVQLNHSELKLNTLYKVRTVGLGLRYFLTN